MSRLGLYLAAFVALTTTIACAPESQDALPIAEDGRGSAPLILSDEAVYQDYGDLLVVHPNGFEGEPDTLPLSSLEIVMSPADASVQSEIYEKKAPPPLVKLPAPSSASSGSSSGAWCCTGCKTLSTPGQAICTSCVPC